MQGNFSIVAFVDLPVSDPLHERTMVASSFNLILHPILYLLRDLSLLFYKVRLVVTQLHNFPSN